MIIVQTPLRISLFGGGTDFASFYLQEGGCTLSTTIDKYIFVTIKRRFDQKLRVGYTRTELVDDLDEVEHELIREALRMTDIRRGVELTTLGDIPSEGSGLGSSSTVTVGALHAMYSYRGELVSAERLASEACQIEIDTLGHPVGVQDQYIAAYGGLRFTNYGTDGIVHTHKLQVEPDYRRRLNKNLLLFFTGTTRRAQKILHKQKANIAARIGTLREMKAIAYAAQTAVLAGELDAIGLLLDESWQLKKQLAAGISNGDIDDLYALGRRAGATGGKITGAGGGGFLLLYCPEGTQESVRTALKHLQELPFQFEPDGSKIIFNYQR